MVPRLFIALAALLFSTGGAAIKVCSLDAWQVACFRSTVAAVALLLFLPAARRGMKFALVPWALAFAATLVLFVTSTKLTTSANAIYLQSTAPLYVMFFAGPMLGERLARRDLLVAALFVVGLVLFFVVPEVAHATAPKPREGNLLAALSGATFALTVIGLRKTGRGSSDASLGVVVLGNLIAALACAPLALPVHGASSTDALVLLYLGVVQIGVAYWCVTRGLQRVSAFEGSLLLMVEPALNPLWTYLVKGERPALLALVGGAAILCASALKSWLDSRRPAAA